VKPLDSAAEQEEKGMKYRSRYTKVMALLIAASAAAPCQPLRQEPGQTKGAPLLEQHTRMQARGTRTGDAAFAHHSQLFANTPRGWQFEAVRTEDRGRFEEKVSRSRGRTPDTSGARPEVNVGGSQAGASLTLDNPVTLPLSLPAQTGPTLFAGEYGFQLVVPAQATRLEITLNATPADAEVAIIARYGQDVQLSAGNLSADFASPGASATERLVITNSSTPALRGGTYYVAFGVLTAGKAIGGTITALASTATGPIGTELKSCVSKPFSLPAVTGPTLFTAEYGYYVTVPSTAKKLEIALATTTSGVNMMLYANFGADVTVVNGQAKADHASSTPAGQQKIVIDASTAPPLHSGTYYIAVGLLTAGKAATGTVQATIDDGAGCGSGGVTTLNFTFALPAVSRAALFAGDYGTHIDVPSGVTRLDISIAADKPNVDVDLYVRRGRDLDLANGRPVADYLSEGMTGTEKISITPSSGSTIEPGTYYIGYGVFTTGVDITGSGKTEMQTSSASGPSTPAKPITPTTPATPTSPTPNTCNFSLPAVSGNTLFGGDYGCRFTVAGGTTSLEFKMALATPNVNVVVYVRAGRDIELSGGRAVADYSADSSGSGSIAVPSSAIRAGDYYVGFGVFTKGTPISGTVTMK
jgi:hypothetical protein